MRSSPADAHGCDHREPSKEENTKIDLVMVGEIEPQRLGNTTVTTGAMEMGTWTTPSGREGGEGRRGEGRRRRGGGRW